MAHCHSKKSKTIKINQTLDKVKEIQSELNQHLINSANIKQRNHYIAFNLLNKTIRSSADIIIGKETIADINKPYIDEELLELI